MTAEYIYNIIRRLIMDARDGKNSVTAEEIAGEVTDDLRLTLNQLVSEGLLLWDRGRDGNINFYINDKKK